MKSPGRKHVSRINVGLRNTDDYRSGWDAVFKKTLWQRFVAWVRGVLT